MKPRAKTETLAKLLSRMTELNVPADLFTTQTIKMINSGKFMLIAVTVQKPCKCDLCKGWHKSGIIFLSAPTKKPLEELFKA